MLTPSYINSFRGCRLYSVIMACLMFTGVSYASGDYELIGVLCEGEKLFLTLRLDNGNVYTSGNDGNYRIQALSYDPESGVARIRDPQGAIIELAMQKSQSALALTMVVTAKEGPLTVEDLQGLSDEQVLQVIKARGGSSMISRRVVNRAQPKEITSSTSAPLVVGESNLATTVAYANRHASNGEQASSSPSAPVVGAGSSIVQKKKVIRKHGGVITAENDVVLPKAEGAL